MVMLNWRVPFAGPGFCVEPELAGQPVLVAQGYIVSHFLVQAKQIK